MCNLRTQYNLNAPKISAFHPWQPGKTWSQLMRLITSIATYMARWLRVRIAILDFHGGTIQHDNFFICIVSLWCQWLWHLNINYCIPVHRSHQHVNRTLSSVGGTVAAACASWEEYARRHERLLDDYDANTDRMPMILNESNKHLCWAGTFLSHCTSKWTAQSAILTFQCSIHSTAHVAGGTHHAFKDYGEGFCIFSGRVIDLIFAWCFSYELATLSDIKLLIDCVIVKTLRWRRICFLKNTLNHRLKIVLRRPFVAS